MPSITEARRYMSGRLVNGENRAKELTVMGVDGLITDNPVMAREVVYSKYSNTLIYNVLSYVFKG